MKPGGGSDARVQATRSVVWARNGMVAAAQPLAVLAGVEILRTGGSAVDAAIAVNACLTVTEPTSCGLGGDLCALVWDLEQSAVVGLNATGRAPHALTADRVRAESDGTIPLRSPFSWTVPGCVDGWCVLHARYGRLPLARVLAPAIEYARAGFPVSRVIAGDWTRAAEICGGLPGFAEVFLPQGRAPHEGEMFSNPALGAVLEEIAQGGRETFYSGRAAEAIVRFSERHGGFFDASDFAEHTSTWDMPICTDYRGLTVWELPPNGQGLAVLQMLNMIEGFDLASLGRESAEFWHILIEAKKLVYADRARYYADPSMVDVPVEELLSKSYARARASCIAHRASRVDVCGDPLAAARGDTTYLCAGDANGCLVSLIQSNYTGFGSGYVIPDLGFGLQNRGALFALRSDHPNRIEPGKRPFHTIIPGMITEDHRPLLAFGVMGGDMQPQGQVQVLVNLRDLNMNLQEAGDAPRFHHAGSGEPTGSAMRDGGIVHLEPELFPAIADGLRLKGHSVEHAPVATFGGYQVVFRDPETGCYAGATERRKDGCALGY
jgi:gamma-glutamyltranspeptidase/glutathione hydrolase